MPDDWHAYEACTCTYTFTETVGTFDAVTNVWLPDRPTIHITLTRDPDCPFHIK